MNWWIIASALCWLAGAIPWFWQGNYRMTIVAVCYAIATLALESAK